jgi:ArsR family transcriptional regulator
LIDDLVGRSRRLPPEWRHLTAATLSTRAEDAVASRSCGDLIVMLGPGSTGLLTRINGRAGYGGFVFVVDPSSGVLNWTIERVSESQLVNIDVRRNRLTSLPFHDCTADLVVSPLSLHHEPDPLAVLREVSRVLVPYGRFLLLDAVFARGDTVLGVCGGRALPESPLRDRLAASGLDAVRWITLDGAWVHKSGGTEFRVPLTLVEALKNPLGS